MADTSITLTHLDFTEYRNSLKSYLLAQDAFKDYDFDGSNMSVLLDLLAHNTYQNAFYLNMVANEMFLDSAKLRDSVISHAKELNYLPKSFTSAKATITLNITPTDPNKNSIVVPKGTAFITRVDDRTFTFSTVENVVMNNKVNGTFQSDTIDIYEGNYLSDTYLADYDNPLVFKINNITVDTSSVSVVVIEDNGSVTLEYSRATSLFGHDSNSQIFFLQASQGDKYEVVFGDGVIGRKPKNGAIIVIQYRSSSGELPNGAYKFITSGKIDGEANITVITSAPAADGAVAESAASIKYNAPRAFTTQERAVTSEDYENLLRLNYPEINAVTAFGGEEANPPQYGRVFVSVDLTDIDGLPKTKKDEYTRFLKSRSSVAMDPVFINPEYIYIDVKSKVKYNINKTGLNPQDIRSYVIDSILTYASTNLNNFAKTLRYSKFIQTIDAADASIVSNETELLLTKYLTPTLNVPVNYTIDFKTPLANDLPPFTADHVSTDLHCIESTPFTYAGVQNCILEDDGNGQVRAVSTAGGIHKIVSYVGTVNYAAGIVSLSGFKISAFDGTSLKIYARSKSKDIVSTQNVILNIIEPDVNITIEQIRE